MNNAEQKSTDCIPNLTDFKPCPFCGGRPYLREWNFSAVVVCIGCRACGPETISGNTREERARLAMKLWEYRVSNGTTERNQKLEAALQTLKQILTPVAGNRRLMQVASPARQCLNIINQLNK